MERTVQSQITSIINDVDDMTIATLRPDGSPQATTVSYVNEDRTIYFMTSPASQKVRNVARDGRVSVTIDRPYETWSDIESLSMTGRATLVTDPQEQARAKVLMLGKFPQAAEVVPDTDQEIAVVRVEPQWISLLDYSKGFGHTELFEQESVSRMDHPSVRARYPDSEKAPSEPA